MLNRVKRLIAGSADSEKVARINALEEELRKLRAGTVPADGKPSSADGKPSSAPARERKSKREPKAAALTRDQDAAVFMSGQSAAQPRAAAVETDSDESDEDGGERLTFAEMKQRGTRMSRRAIETKRDKERSTLKAKNAWCSKSSDMQHALAKRADDFKRKQVRGLSLCVRRPRCCCCNGRRVCTRTLPCGFRGRQRLRKSLRRNSVPGTTAKLGEPAGDSLKLSRYYLSICKQQYL
jgi:hypothetical protein